TLIDKRLKCWRERSGAADAKVILLAHSMGGLISRYYLEVLGGWQDAKALFTFGTPHRGSINGLNFLANDYKKLSFDLTNVMRSLTSVYQLLPIYQAVKVGNDFVRVTETNEIPHVIQARAQDARAFHDEIYDAVQKNKENEIYQKQFTTVPIVGIRQPTLQSAELKDGKLSAIETLPKILQGRTDFIDGDGTVPKISAIPNELSNSFNNRFIAEAHGALQNQKQILRAVQEAIATTQFENAFEVKDGQATIGLSVDDLYLPDEPISLQAKVISDSEIDGLTAAITPVAENAQPLSFAFERSPSDNWTLSIEMLPAGLYRVAVSAEGKENQPLPSTVHNLFEVME
ncbi:MAG: lecithin--cholesterol acyltransferase, partial [Phormidesmis sp.]